MELRWNGCDGRVRADDARARTAAWFWFQGLVASCHLQPLKSAATASAGGPLGQRLTRYFERGDVQQALHPGEPISGLFLCVGPLGSMPDNAVTRPPGLRTPLRVALTSPPPPTPPAAALLAHRVYPPQLPFLRTGVSDTLPGAC